MASPMASQAGAVIRDLPLLRATLLRRNPGIQLTPRRWLNLQEYQSKKLMADHGVTVQKFFVADTANDAIEAAKRLQATEIVLKAQILAGGRGKGVFSSGLKGGVHLTKDPKVVGQLAKQMIGYNLTTKQTPKGGVKVKKEEIDIFEGVKDNQAVRLAENLGFKGPLQQQVEAILVNIFGGIVNCAIIANGITKACRELELKVPLVVRLEGTNVHEAQRILNESGLPITSASDLEDAAKKAVACVTKK
ncbi:PREDICTED: succinyl-CoA ligase [GDP-forming] subunit beta, mitochondrial [Thamnophis sirtalis]|uniref:Succinyl-CoA ligase [GDP-forming] subunit beta, mitochondrial n=1 Tax=Thamnophis sirtalis TaxID=35019 RepID=A0A6I9YK62_9SAUR|nr:PREDICTED: succinyl-CoA ligase [GDP-forming] subunit beta, mitochondrial [Thamnophis sirtalis]